MKCAHVLKKHISFFASGVMIFASGVKVKPEEKKLKHSGLALQKTNKQTWVEKWSRQSFNFSEWCHMRIFASIDVIFASGVKIKKPNKVEHSRF